MGVVTKQKKFLCWMILALTSATAHAQRVEYAYESNFKIVRALLEQPESQMDLASIKLTIDQMVDPSTDKAAIPARQGGIEVLGKVVAEQDPQAQLVSTYRRKLSMALN